MATKAHHICVTITYETDNGTVESELCYTSETGEPVDEHRKILHQALNEWLEKSNGTGYFQIARPIYWHRDKDWE